MLFVILCCTQNNCHHSATAPFPQNPVLALRAALLNFGDPKKINTTESHKALLALRDISLLSRIYFLFFTLS